MTRYEGILGIRGVVVQGETWKILEIIRPKRLRKR
jgi:hypothetical protein